MRYQELFFSAFVLGAAIASDNCRHSGNMPLRHARSTPMPLPQTHSHHFTPAGTALRPSWSYLRAGAAGVWRVDPAPNDPGLLAAKGGAAGGGCALMRTLGAIPAAIVTGMDRIGCPITQIFRYRLTKRHRAGAPSPTTAPPMRDAQKASFDSLQPKGPIARRNRPRRHAYFRPLIPLQIVRIYRCCPKTILKAVSTPFARRLPDQLRGSSVPLH